MNESFIVYNEFAILNKLSEFPATLGSTETRIFTYILNVNSCKNDVTPSIDNVIMPYVIDDVMKIKLATE